jgi:hypothetical protein
MDKVYCFVGISSALFEMRSLQIWQISVVYDTGDFETLVFLY